MARFLSRDPQKMAKEFRKRHFVEINAEMDCLGDTDYRKKFNTPALQKADVADTLKQFMDAMDALADRGEIRIDKLKVGLQIYMAIMADTEQQQAETRGNTQLLRQNNPDPELANVLKFSPMFDELDDADIEDASRITQDLNEVMTAIERKEKRKPGQDSKNTKRTKG